MTVKLGLGPMTLKTRARPNNKKTRARPNNNETWDKPNDIGSKPFAYNSIRIEYMNTHNNRASKLSTL